MEMTYICMKYHHSYSANAKHNTLKSNPLIISFNFKDTT